MRPAIVLNALWDPEARVWVAESDDVPGLVAEAESIEALAAKLEVLIPELLEANGRPMPRRDVDLVATRSLRYAG
jgi:predicted RNase H-like HicB family nuclease